VIQISSKQAPKSYLVFVVFPAQHFFFGNCTIPSCPRKTSKKLFSNGASPRLITVFRTRPPTDTLMPMKHSDRHFQLRKSLCLSPLILSYFHFNISIFMPGIATGISRFPSFLFPSLPHLCLRQAGSLHLTRKPDGFKAPPRPDKMAHKAHRRWRMTSDAEPTVLRSITALSLMCTPLHLSPFYRILSLPLRDLHIIPNQTWSTSPSPTRHRRMLPSCDS
jgi:hypothetical protein